MHDPKPTGVGHSCLGLLEHTAVPKPSTTPTQPEDPASCQGERGVGGTGLEDAESCPQPQNCQLGLLPGRGVALEGPCGNREKFISRCACPQVIKDRYSGLHQQGVCVYYPTWPKAPQSHLSTLLSPPPEMLRPIPFASSQASLQSTELGQIPGQTHWG